MMSLWDALRMNMMISYQELVRTFPNFGSIGVVVGAFSAISPKRAPEIAQLGLRALAAATLSNLMSATIAGFFIGLA
ncbi:nucleoside transporter C-terminal domain-containing protein [Escherichia coli]|uniref:nucleoside transporter C-terminal domain-containing protein n=1 Tax=Escherichia coli TaxID=562 RepID=UPI002E11EA0B